MRNRFLTLAGVATLLIAATPGQADDSAARGNFDIRLAEDKTVSQELAERRLRYRAGVSPSVEIEMRAAREQMERRMPALYVLDSVETGAPEVVGVSKGRTLLTGPSSEPREQIARRFVEENAALWGLSRAQAVALETDADYTNPAGNLSWVRLKQTLGGLPLFRGTITLAFTPRGEIARTTGQLAAGLPPSIGSALPGLTAAEAVAAAAATLGKSIAPESLVLKERSPDGARFVFARGPWSDDVTVELLYFPLGPGAVELAWSALLWGDVDAHWTIVSAGDGGLLWRKNISEEVAFNYRVYTSDSPAPFSPFTGIPGDVNPDQGVGVAASLVAVESENSLNDPWLQPGAVITDGNNVEAGIDRDGTNGVDPVGIPGTTSALTFDYTYNPPPLGADNPLGAAYQDGISTNLFFWTNRYHDRVYDLGFTEPAFNFQADNYGRGGTGGDRISAEAQDSSGTNNANFNTPPDGARGRMQMFLWTGPTPDRDGDIDMEVILHELTHGLSNRLHGNASGLSTNMSRGMGEGWSDFYAQSILSEPGDDPNGIYALGGYATYLITGGFVDNYYYGIRRFPKAVRSNTGGAGNLPHNPLTFADIDSTQIVINDGAYPPGPIGTPNAADQVHNVGEIWSSALWEVRAKIMARLGNTPGNNRMLQLVTDGMKLDPVGPTFLQARDAIIAADCAGFAGEDEADIWSGFAIRGMGFSAQVLNPGTGSGSARVVEAFDGGGVTAGSGSWQNASCSTAPRNPTPGELIWVLVLLENPFCATDVPNVVVSIAGGGSRSYGTLAAGGSVLAAVPYTIPEASTCGAAIQIDVQIDSDLGSTIETVEVPVGPQAITTTSFTNPTLVNLPSGQPATTSGPAAPYPSTINVSGIIDPVVGVTVTLNGLTHTYPGDLDFLLVAPNGDKMIFLSDVGGTGDVSNITLTLDDGAAELPSASQLVSGSFRPSNEGANDAFAGPAPAGPYGNATPAGTDTFASVFGGDDANGNWSLYAVDDVGGDVGTLSGGWTIGILTQDAVVCAPCTATDLFSDGFETGDTTRWTATVGVP